MTLYAEFTGPEALLAAADRLHALGYSRLDAYAPFPMPGLDERLGIKRTRLSVPVFLAGLTGVVVAFLAIWYTNAVSYPLDVGGRPLDSLPADIPIVFETMILFAGITAFTLAFVLNGMPRLWDPAAEIEGIERTTIDRYWLVIDPSDAVFDPSVKEEMEQQGAVVRDVGGEP